jgi:hypothetical protein
MAYLVPLSKPTCRDCRRRATVEMFNAYNASMGTFCKRHGKLRMRVYEEPKGVPALSTTGFVSSFGGNEGIPIKAGDLLSIKDGKPHVTPRPRRIRLRKAR